MVDSVPYDEFSMFHENAAEFGLALDQPPVVRRDEVALGDGRRLSALVWGESEPELFFVHGAAQNAHTFDTVALALDRPLVAVDLPGHGHSGSLAPIADAAAPAGHARDVAIAFEALAPHAQALVGMSLGGLTSIEIAAARPDLVRRLVIIDITPGVTGDKAKAITDFVRGPREFANFDELLARTVEHNPTRSESSLRRGILHNALQRDDGTWVWRHRRDDSDAVRAEFEGPIDHTHLWDKLEHLAMPIMLVRGTRPQSVIDDTDVAEFRRRQPNTLVVELDAGHSVQGDAPLELAAAIEAFVYNGEADPAQKSTT